MWANFWWLLRGHSCSLSVSIVDTQQVVIHHRLSCTSLHGSVSLPPSIFHNNGSRLGPGTDRKLGHPSVSVLPLRAGHHSHWTLQLKPASTSRPFGPLTSKIIHHGTKQSTNTSEIKLSAWQGGASLVLDTNEERGGR